MNDKMRENKKNTRLLYPVYVILIIFAATGFCMILSMIGIENESIILVYLIAVLISTVISKGYIFGFITAVFSLLSYNYFFAYPHFTFRINDIQEVIMMCFFFVTALIGGGMSSRYKTQSRISAENERTTKLMYEITENFVDITGIENIVNTTMDFIYRLTGEYSTVSVYGKTYTNNPHLTDAPERYTIPITGKSKQLGTLTVFTSRNLLSADEDKIIKAAIYQMALVLDREAIYTERENYKLDMQTERLKSTLLRSISHDIRTPLTGILGAATTIVENDDVLKKEDVTALAKDIMEESEWLILTVQNILNMTRLSDNTLTLHKDIELVDDLISQAITRISRVYPKEIHKLSSEIPDELIFVNVDGALFVSVLINLLDNAFKHSDNHEKIVLRAYSEGENAIFEVTDDGCGIDENVIHNIFEGFVTHNDPSSDRSRGMGLGLSICRAIVNAHGGTITAQNLEKGASFRVTIKREEENS
ncbi:MAG: DUF4118 domain-containing protein [Eubacteriaceae bacterium]|nr:DUF4118 domain-containing protein [Eubacteriaceae bacterium]